MCKQLRSLPTALTKDKGVLPHSMHTRDPCFLAPHLLLLPPKIRLLWLDKVS